MMKTFKEYLKESGTGIIKSIVAGPYTHNLHKTPFGYQVRVVDKDGKQVHSDISKNTEEKGLKSLESNVNFTKKQFRIDQ
jgi:hypothetical protein